MFGTRQWLFVAMLSDIELNPVRALMVESPADYKWSSFQANAYGKVTKLRTPHPLYLELGASVAQRASAYRQLFLGQIDEEFLQRVRLSTNQGMVLGNAQFKEQVSILSGRRASIAKAGRPKREQ